MIVEYVRYTIPPDRAAAFEAAYADAQASLAAAPQCLRYELARCTEEPASYVLRIEWTSLADHMTGFRTGPHFPAFFAAVRPFVECIAEMRHYEPTAVQGVAG